MEAEAAGAGKRGCIDEGARGIVRLPRTAIGAVGAAGERRAAARPRQRNCQRQRILLVGPAAALAAQRHREFATRKYHGAPPLRREIAGKSCLRGGDFARLALDRSTEQDAFVAGGVRRVLYGAEDLGGPRRQPARGGGGSPITR